MDKEQLEKLAGLLATHWRARMSEGTDETRGGSLLTPARLLGDGFAVPADLPEAYAVQDALLERIGEARGWKVGRSPLGITCAPIYRQIFHEASSPVLPPIYSDMEVEVAFRFDNNLDVRSAPFPAHEILEAVGATHVSMELLQPRVQAAEEMDSRLLTLADGLACGALIIGTGAPGYVDVGQVPREVAAMADGKNLAVADSGLPPSPPEELLVWLVNHLAARGHSISRGDWVTTGSWVGKLPLGKHERLTGHIAGIGSVQVELSLDTN